MKKSIIAIIVLVILLVVVLLIVHKPGTSMSTGPSATTPAGTVDNSGAGNANNPSQGSGNPSTVTATTTVNASPSPHAITLDGVSPTSAAVGATIFITGSGFTDSNTILFNSNVAAKDVHVASTQGNTQTIFFTVPSSIGPDCQPNEACPQYMQLVTAGSYNLSVENANGKSNVLQFSVVGQ